MLFGILLIIGIFILWKLFVDGWLFKIILFIFGWFGLYEYLHLFVDGANKTAIIIGNQQFSWAVVIPTLVCVLCLLFTKQDS